MIQKAKFGLLCYAPSLDFHRVEAWDVLNYYFINTSINGTM